MERKNRIPKRRFREFLEAGEWEEKTVKEIAPLQRGFDLPINLMKDGNYPVIASNGIIGYHNQYKVKGPGVVTGRSGTIGNLHYVEKNYWPHNTSLWVTDFKGNWAEFVYYLYTKLDLSKFGTGSGVPTLNRNDVHDTYVFAPSLLEQQRVSNFCRHLDTLISLHQQKLAKLKDLKQAYLTEMFPAPGEKRPRRRFKGFSGDWEEETLCKLAEIKDSARVPNNLWTNKGVPYLRSSDLANKGLMGDLYISHHNYEMYRAQTGAPSKGDVLFTSGGQVGITFLKEDDSPLYVQGGAVLYVKTSSSNNLCGQYLKTFFETNIMQSYMANASVGGTIKHFTVGPASKALITYPSVEEQKLIGNFFKRIDNKLYFCQNKISKLQSLKQAYLSELFV